MHICHLTDVFLVDLFAKFVHLDLLVQDFSYCLLLLLSLHFSGHSESFILLIKGFELLFVLNLSLLGAHETHFETFPGVSEHTVHVL